MIKRFYADTLLGLTRPGKVLALYGPRRVGKTTLLLETSRQFEGRCFVGSGEDRTVREVFAAESVNTLRNAFANYELVIIDEAQTIPDVGKGLKLLADHLPQLRIIASGSSSFDLAGKLGEPLTGRKRTVTLFPVAALELAANDGNMTIRQRLDELLIYGCYPEVLTTVGFDEKRELLSELRDDYLFKDILTLDHVRNPHKLRDLLMLLAFQVGKEVSLSELGGQLGFSKQTVERYLYLLEKAFVIKRVGGFSRNLRKEVTKSSRYYFFDNGVLNSVINNFSSLNARNDVGALWENYLVAERFKKLAYQRIPANVYFWRTYDQQEVDWVEERDGKLDGSEFKWSERRKTKVPAAWRGAYPEAGFEIVTPGNFLSFVL